MAGYDDFDPANFKDKDPQEDSFGLAALQGRMLSSSPSIVAQALGIPVDKAESMDPEAIRRYGRSQARSIAASHQDAIRTQGGPGGVDVKKYLISQVGPPETDIKQIQSQLEVGGKSEQDQRKHLFGMISSLANRVATGAHDGTAVPRAVIDALTYAQKLDVMYSGTGMAPDENGQPTRMRPPGGGSGTGPYQKYLMTQLFDAQHKILPDYLSQGDAQMAGMAPSTNMGGAARPGAEIPGVQRGRDAAGNLSFSNTPAPAGVDSGPTKANISLGAAEPTPYVGSPEIGQGGGAQPNTQPSTMGMGPYDTSGPPMAPTQQMGPQQPKPPAYLWGPGQVGPTPPDPNAAPVRQPDFPADIPVEAPSGYAASQNPPMAPSSMYRPPGAPMGQPSGAPQAAPLGAPGPAPQKPVGHVRQDGKILAVDVHTGQQGFVSPQYVDNVHYRAVS